ncbi:MAG: serine hydrolase, partial [Flavobacteriaceae bacterium]
MKTLLSPLLLILLLTGCSNDDVDTDPDSPEQELYFPPGSGLDWETSSPTTLDWNEIELEGLYDYLESNRTRAFLVLKDGKIVVEKYWGSNITNT